MIDILAYPALVLCVGANHRQQTRPAGTNTRAEVIVSFGNARQGQKSAPNVDINGNGIIDGDEA